MSTTADLCCFTGSLHPSKLNLNQYLGSYACRLGCCAQ
jgi:hypothetical protein